MHGTDYHRNRKQIPLPLLYDLSFLAYESSALVTFNHCNTSLANNRQDAFHLL